MKRVAADDLARVALAKGGMLTHDGGTMNGARKQVDVVRRSYEPMKPVPTPPPPAAAPAAPRINFDAVVQATTAGQASVEKLSSLVIALVREMRSQQANVQKPITGWYFEMSRDGQGRTCGISATATRNDEA